VIRVVRFLGFLVLAGAACAQGPVFEAASVKPSGPRSVRMSNGGPGSSDPQRFSFTEATLQDLLFIAYDLDDEMQISGPRWLSSERYDVVATLAPGASEEQFHLMLRNLMAERFKLALHHQTKESPVYALVIAKNGPKLNGAGQDQDGFPQLLTGRPDMIMTMEGRQARLAARRQPIARLVKFLRGFVDRPIVDQTGLTGQYDFHLDFSLQDSADDPVPRVFEALPEQLGLKLEQRKAPWTS